MIVLTRPRAQKVGISPLFFQIAGENQAWNQFSGLSMAWDFVEVRGGMSGDGLAELETLGPGLTWPGVRVLGINADALGIRSTTRSLDLSLSPP